MIQDNMPEQAAKIIDYFSFAGAVAVVSGFLPVAVGVATLIWTILRIYEMETTKKIIDCFRSKVREGH